MNSNLDDRENRIVNFMDEIEKEKNSKSVSDEFQNSPEVKLRQIKHEKDCARGVCLDAIFSKIYKDAIPMDNDYKVSHGDDLDSEFRDFIHMRNHKGMEYYVKEAIKKGSEPARKIMEAVDRFIREEYHDKEMNVDSLSTDDIKFNINDNEVQSKLNEISSDMNLPEISEIIKDNVKIQTQNEIQRNKAEEENIKQIQQELENDPNITSEAAIDRALKYRGIGLKKTFTPSLFEGIMISKVNAIKESCPDIDAEHVNKAAFTESVKELTKWNVISTFKLEKLGKYEKQKIANNYACGKY